MYVVTGGIGIHRRAIGIGQHRNRRTAFAGCGGLHLAVVHALHLALVHLAMIHALHLAVVHLAVIHALHVIAGGHRR
ncbi:hypothetical protein D3C86_1875040 [compost metagenome]